MGGIYAAADLTIVAAMGDNPTYGLPGATRNSRSSRMERLGHQYMTVIPALGSGYDHLQVTNSPWSLRAWTFQESVLSTRRLILTDRQAILICNTDTRYEAIASRNPAKDPFTGVGWLPPRHARIEESEMETAIIYLRTYSRRILSYDSDALNAIVGALNTLAATFASHYWAVPFGHVSRPQHEWLNPTPCTNTISCTANHKLWFVLAWCHTGTARRRIDFPSWTPIGWKGGIDFYCPLATTDRNHFGRIQTVSHCGVKVITSVGQQRLKSYLQKSDSCLSERSKELQLRGETSVLPVVSAHGVAIPFGHDLYYEFKVDWSVDPEKDGIVGAKIKTLLIQNSRSERPKDWILLLKACETGLPGRYERCGIAALCDPVEEMAHGSHQHGGGFVHWFDTSLKPLGPTSRAYHGFKVTVERISNDTWPGPGAWWRPAFSPEVVTLV
jgi:hypothetical protein